MSSLPLCVALAARCRLPTLWWAQSLGDARRPLVVFGLSPPDSSDGGHHFSRHPSIFALVVSFGLAVNQPKVGGQRPRVAARFGVGQLPNRLDDARSEERRAGGE